MNISNSKKIADLKHKLDLALAADLSVPEKWTQCRSFFYTLVTYLSDEPDMAFNNFYARFRYVLNQLEINENDKQNFNALRRYIKTGVLQITQEDLKQCQWLFDKIYQSLGLEKSTVSTAYNEKYFTQKYPKHAGKGEITLLCTHYEPIKNTDPHPFFTLIGYDLNDLNRKVHIKIKDFTYTKFSDLFYVLEQGFTIHFKHLEHIGRDTYGTTVHSLISIEPDFLVDATAIGACFQNSFDGMTWTLSSNSELFLFSRLMDDLPGPSALKGSIVGYFFDEMLRGNNDTESLFGQAIKAHSLKAARLNAYQLSEIKLSILQQHLPNLLRYVDELKQSGKKIWLEPTYFSAEYGLQGRIDLLLQNDKVKDIVELKSGKPSNYRYSVAWPSHQYQVVVYDLLLNSTYGQNRQGMNAIFYSADPIKPKRNIISESNEQQHALRVRNQIVKHIYNLAKNDFGIFKQFKEQGIALLPQYNNAALSKFKQHYGENPLATKYYNELIAFVLRELITTKTGLGGKIDLESASNNGFASLWLNSIDEKKENFAIIPDLKLQTFDPKNGIIKLKITQNLVHSFRKNDLVIIYPKFKEKYNVLSHHILKASIKNISTNEITLTLNNPQTDYSFFKQHEYWAIEPDIYERNFWSTIANLFHILLASKQKIELLLGKAEPRFDTSIVFPKTRFLSQKQTQAIENALQARDYYLLQGPPGTGKTSTFLVNYLRAEKEIHNKPIVVLAYTNKAVEKICQSLENPRFGEPLNYVRLGGRHTQGKFVFNTLAEKAGVNPEAWRNIIESAGIIVSTIATFLNNARLLNEFIPFDRLVVDEASQLTEADLAGILAMFNKFVLIGDHKQLPPVIVQNEHLCRVKDNDLHSIGFTDHRISLFERLYENAKSKGWQKSIGQLTEHYRMHRDIAHAVSIHYDSILKDIKDEQRFPGPIYHISIEGISGNIGKHRLVFIDTKPDILPKKNRIEAQLCAAIVDGLLKLKKNNEYLYNPGDIGIITPFRAQISEIRNRLHKINNHRITDELIVDTVERFQGDERKIIIFSTTAADASQLSVMQSFSPIDSEMKTDRKLLVSISRAKEQFIMLGNSGALRHSASYNSLINDISAKNAYFNYVENTLF